MEAIRHLLAATVLVVHHARVDVIARDRWRREHEARAVISHHKRRGEPIPIHLRI